MASAMSFILLLLVAIMLIAMYAIYRKRTLAKRNV
jgi:ABC-type spermidine/putrescine transport system permease subunit I